MRKVSLWLPLILSVLYGLYSPIFFPSVRFAIFAPLLAMAFHRYHLINCLWLSFLCGGFIDLFSSQMKFGLHALALCLSTCVCYQQKRHFFEEKSSALSLFSAFISSVQSLSLMLVSAIFDKQVSLTYTMILSDVIVTSLYDGIYAFVAFTVPIKIFSYLRSGKWKQHFQKKEES